MSGLKNICCMNNEMCNGTHILSSMPWLGFDLVTLSR
jgi:hypothetical protein